MRAGTRGLALVVLVLVAGVACEARPAPSSPPVPTGLPAATDVQPTIPGAPEPTARPMPSLPPAAFRTEITAPDETDPLEVALVDATGLVVELKPMPIVEIPPAFGVGPAPAPDQGLLFVWGTSLCDPWALLTLVRVDAGFRLTTQTEPAPTCLAIEMIRPLIIVTKEPIDPASVELATAFEAKLPGVGDRFALDVHLVDRTDLVLDLAEDRTFMRLGLHDAQAPVRGLFYGFTFSYCAERLALVFEDAPQGRYRLHQDLDVDWSGMDCAGSTVGHYLFIRLREPVRAVEVELMQPTE